MNASTRLSTLLASCLLAAAPTAFAMQAQEGVTAPDTDCRDLADPDALAEVDLKSFYLRCSDAAMEGRLDWGEVALCSLAYERLLRETFGGDFLALLAWSRTQPVQGAAPGAPRALCAAL